MQISDQKLKWCMGMFLAVLAVVSDLKTILSDASSPALWMIFGVCSTCLVLLVGLYFTGGIERVQKPADTAAAPIRIETPLTSAEDTPGPDYGITIISPADKEIVEKERIEVHGKYIKRPPGEWLLITQNEDLFWIHHNLQFAEKDFTWQSGVTLTLPQTKPQVIKVVELTDEILWAVDYYRKAAWPGIKLPPGLLNIAAEVDVRTKDRSIRLATLDVRPIRQDQATYRLKLYVTMRNDSPDAVEIRPPVWTAAGDQLQLQPPFSYRYSVERSQGGRMRNEWLDELSSVTVPPGAAFRLWLPLNDSYTEKTVADMIAKKQIGTLVLPTASPAQRKQYQIGW